MRKYENLTRVINAGRALVDDQTASIAPDLYDEMRYSGSLIKAGTRINWHGVLKRAAVDLWDTEENSPENAPALWEDIAYKKGIRIIPDMITAGMAFGKGERGWWKDVLYESVMDNNVWTPDAWQEGWARIE